MSTCENDNTSILYSLKNANNSFFKCILHHHIINNNNNLYYHLMSICATPQYDSKNKNLLKNINYPFITHGQETYQGIHSKKAKYQ